MESDQPFKTSERLDLSSYLSVDIMSTEPVLKREDSSRLSRKFNRPLSGKRHSTSSRDTVCMTSRTVSPDVIDAELDFEPDFALPAIDNQPDTVQWSSHNLQSYDLTALPILQPPIDNDPSMSDFGKLTHIWKGPCSDIYRGRFGDLSVVLKVIRDSSVSKALANREFRIEYETLSRMNHPHIISMYGCGITRMCGTGEEDSRPKISFLLLQDLTGDTLAHHLAAKKSAYGQPFSTIRCLQIARELADALRYIHYKFHPDCVVIHRDLKPDNIGFTKDGTLKLFDFGLCTSLRRGASDRAVYQLSGCTGTFRYMAPETALTLPYNEKVDVYGFAMVMYEVATGCTPFPHYTKERFYREVVRGGARPSLEIDTHGNRIKMPLDLKTLIAQCWDTDYMRRPTSTQAYYAIAEVERKVAMKADLQTHKLRSSFTRFFSRKDTI